MLDRPGDISVDALHDDDPIEGYLDVVRVPKLCLPEAGFEPNNNLDAIIDGIDQWPLRYGIRCGAQA